MKKLKILSKYLGSLNTRSGKVMCASVIMSFSLTSDVWSLYSKGFYAELSRLPNNIIDVRALVWIQSQSDSPQGLTTRERVEVFDKVWTDINDYFYDPSFNRVNWQEVRDRYRPALEAVTSDIEFYALLNRMAGELRDAHTRILSPAQVANGQQGKRLSFGFRVEDVEGSPVITSVTPGSDAARAGFEPGMIVVRVNGTNAADRIAEIRKTIGASSSKRLDETRVYAITFGGPPGTTLKLGLQRSDGSTFDASITGQLLASTPTLTIQTLNSGSTYIAFDQFTMDITKQFKEALKKLEGSPGLIIDLRNNNGGSSQALYQLVATLYQSKELFLRSATRNGRPIPDGPPAEIYVGNEGSQLYSGPIVVLVGPRSGSTAELFAAALQETKRAKVVGSQSCGCAVGINKQRKLKGGAVLQIGEVLWVTPAGRKIEGEGVIPDRRVTPTLADVRSKRDPVISVAEKLLNESSSERPKE